MAKSIYLNTESLLALLFSTDSLINKSAQASSSPVADVISVHVSGAPNAYQFDTVSLLSWCAG